MRRARVGVGVLLATAIGTPRGLAQPAEPAAAAAPGAKLRHTIVSLPLLALSSRALAVQVERPAATRISWAVALGLRDAAGGDYQGQTGALGLESRLWLRRSQQGPFAGARVEGALTHLSRADVARSLGTALTLTEGLLLGYRLVLARRVELTADLGFALRQDLAHDGVPAQARATWIYGITAGWIFRPR